MKLSKKVLVALLASALAACGAKSSSPTGQLTVNAFSSALSSSPDVAKVSITLTNTATQAVLHGEMSNSKSDKSGRWSIFFDRIPVGTYAILAQALNAADVVLYATPQPLPRADVSANGTTNVTLLLQETQAPNPYLNSAPYITTLVVSQRQIDPGTTISLSVTAADPDAGDAVTYAWSSSAGGTFSDPAAARTTWSPAGNGDSVITIAVADSHGAKVSASVTINVTSANARGAIAAVVDLNNFPQVSVTSAQAQGPAGQPIPLSARASDPDGDPLSFAWASSCGGTLSSTTGTSTTDAQGTTNVTSFTPAAQGDCTVTVTVSDDRGGTNTGALLVRAQPVAIVEGPQFSLQPLGAVDLNPGDQVEIQALPDDGQAHAWTYVWSDGFAVPKTGTFTAVGSGGAEQVYAPAACSALGPGDQTVTISTLATDPGTGASNTRALSLVVHCP